MINGFGFDANGNQVTSTDALGRTTTSVYDDLNRMIQTVYADGTTNFTGYDVAGRRVAETNQDSVVTRFGYDGAGRLIAVTNAFLARASRRCTHHQISKAKRRVFVCKSGELVAGHGGDTMSCNLETFLGYLLK